MPISTNATELIKAIAPGRHKVSLEIFDNSIANNNSASDEKYFFANSGPKPVIQGPTGLFQGESATYRSMVSEDADGDDLSTQWKIDGVPVNRPELTLSEARTYTVTLIQNDGRGLPNSVDSTILKVNPIKIPDVTPSYPARVAQGVTFSIADLNIRGNWLFVNNGRYDSTWTPSSVGENTFTLAWLPRGEELSQSSFNVTIVERLQFTETPEPQTIEWNPANPVTTLKVPSFNRNVADVNIVWTQNGEVVGRGLEISPTLVQGQNTYTVEVTDLKVAQSTPISISLVVNTQ